MPEVKKREGKSESYGIKIFDALEFVDFRGKKAKTSRNLTPLPLFLSSLFLFPPNNRTISNSTYLRRLFICAHMAPLFPSPVDRKSFMSSISNGNGSASSSSGAWPSPPLPQPTCSSSSSASAPPPSSSSSLLCAASLASLVASDVTKYSRIQETVAERSFRQRRAAAGEGGTGAGGGSNSDFIFDVPAARAAPAAPPAFLSALALASAAAAGPVPRVASYEAVPQLDPQGRAFCVVIEWLRSTTSKKEFLWKVSEEGKFFFLLFFFFFFRLVFSFFLSFFSREKDTTFESYPSTSNRAPIRGKSSCRRRENA